MRLHAESHVRRQQPAICGIAIRLPRLVRCGHQPESVGPDRRLELPRLGREHPGGKKYFETRIARDTRGLEWIASQSESGGDTHNQVKARADKIP